jgi:hypothetical protein
MGIIDFCDLLLFVHLDSTLVCTLTYLLLCFLVFGAVILPDLEIYSAKDLLVVIELHFLESLGT